jgi:pimeloyl-ACP methyl ester carboxylesterase
MTEKTKPPEPYAGADWTQQVWLWPLEATKLALHSYAQWFADQKPAPSRAPDLEPLAWTTPNAVVLQLPTMRLREFSRGNRTQPPVLVCAPYALHGAVIADFAPRHSLVEALQKDGVNRIYVPDWRSAVPDMRYLSIDNYLAELNVAIDEIGAPVDLVGLCQGGWLSLVYAARFPGKVRRLVLAGAPVDVSTPSELSKMVAAVPQPAFEQMVQQGDGLVSGEHMLKLWNIPFSQQDVETTLQRNLGDGSDEAAPAGSFRALGPCDAGSAGGLLPRGDRPGFPAKPDRGRALRRARPQDRSRRGAGAGLPAGGSRRHRRPARSGVRHRTTVGTRPAWLERACEPCGHLSLFMGRGALSHSWRRIARWLQADIGDTAGARLSA